MIELSFTKLLLVAVIALIVLGPEKLPKAARMAGAMLRRARAGWESVRGEVERELEMEEIRRAAREARESARSFQDSAEAAVKSARDSVSETAAGFTAVSGAETAAGITADSGAEARPESTRDAQRGNH